VTALLSVAPKAAGFAIMVRFFYTGLSITRTQPALLGHFRAIDWTPLLIAISA